MIGHWLGQLSSRNCFSSDCLTYFTIGYGLIQCTLDCRMQRRTCIEFLLRLMILLMSSSLMTLLTINQSSALVYRRRLPPFELKDRTASLINRSFRVSFLRLMMTDGSTKIATMINTITIGSRLLLSVFICFMC